jgi:hypothetical protein
VETAGATDLIKGTGTVEVPGRFDPEKQDSVPEPITLLEPRLVSDFITAPCKHKCSIVKQVSHEKKAQSVLSSLNPVKKALLRTTLGQCGMDLALCTMDTARDVAGLDHPGKENGGEDSKEASLFCAATLHRFGLPLDYARLNADIVTANSLSHYRSTISYQVTMRELVNT